MTERHYGRLVPSDFDHVTRHPYAAVAPATAATVERCLPLPWWHWSHDQGRQGACVGFGVAMERAITNTMQNRALALTSPVRRYNAIHVWNEAKKIDEWPDTNPGDSNGTSVRAGYDVCRAQGLQRVTSMQLSPQGVATPVGVQPTSIDEGVVSNRWAVNVDEMRTAIAAGLPVTIGIDWYSAFENPFIPTGYNQHWIAVDSTGTTKTNLGQILGGHCLAVYGASDRRQAFKLRNNWGRSWPLTWLPYTVMQKLLDDQGEAALVTDR